MMKKMITICLPVIVFAGLAWGKVDFTKPAPVKQFTVSVSGPEKASSKKGSASNKIMASTSTPPANVLPIDVYRGEVKVNGEKVPLMSGCAAIRLTPTLVLTAGHCLQREQDKGGFANQERIYAIPMKQKDGLWRLNLFPKEKDQPFKPNAQVSFFRPNYSGDKTQMGHVFDFGLVKLDNKLKIKSAAVSTDIKVDLEGIPEELQSFVSEQIDQTQQVTRAEIQKSLEKEQATYKQFMSSSLQKFDLLQIDPDMVKKYLKGRTIRAYYWEPSEANQQDPGERKQAQVLSGSCPGTDDDLKHNHNTHMLIFNIKTHEGTSGSPFVDLSRKQVISVVSGPCGNSTSCGGIISPEICQWVKSYDSSVECFEVRGTAIYQETNATANWGR